MASELNRALRENGFPAEAGPEAHEVRKKWLFELDRATGEVLEVFDVALDDYVFAGTPGEPAKGRMVHRNDVEPDPFEAVLREGLVPWHDR